MANKVGEMKKVPRQRDHFDRIIREKWECDQAGHGVCVPTDDGQHWQLSEQHVKAWVNLLVKGVGTTAEPPPGTFEDIGGGAVYDRKRGILTVQAVPISPARQRRLPGGSQRQGESITWHSAPGTEGGSVISDNKRGPGSLVAKGLRWLGRRGLLVVEEAAAANQGNSHIFTFKTWQNKKFLIGPTERRHASEMLEDALEMAKPCFPKRINWIAYEIGKEAQNWLAKADLPITADNILLLLRAQVCMTPLILIRISDNDPFAGDLAWELLDALTRAPLLLIDDIPDSKQKSTNYEGTTAIAIRIVARELAYSKCVTQHPWLAVQLIRIVELTLTIRPLSESELAAIWELACRREEQTTDDVKTDSRSWEVALFAHCSAQGPQFKEAVLRPTGLPYLIKTIEMGLAKLIHNENVPWENVTVTFRTLASLTEHDWVVHSDVVNEGAVVAIMSVFRRDIPEKHLPLHYWATETLRNVIALRPKLIPILIKGDILIVLSKVIPSITSPSKSNLLSSSPPTLILPLPPLPPEHGRSDRRDSRDSQRSSSSHRRGSTASVYPAPDIMTPAQGKLLDDYRRDMARCAEELAALVNAWKPEPLPTFEPALPEELIYLSFEP
ncbi:hypothetical protein BU17DRAFT_71381 [Hysterangium stoloniferum]|nr:hypothetical protein BU17DRAFT_71381 [Hysterangium stoloniferum]